MSPAPPTSRIALILAFAAIWVVWGSTYYAIAVAIDTLPPLLMAGSRFVVAGLGVLVYALARGAPRPNAVQWRSAGIVGVLMLLGGNGLVTLAQQAVPSSIAALIITTVPLWMTGLDAVVFGGARPTVRAWIGLVLGFAGVAILLRPSPDDLASWPLLGSLTLLAAAFCWANGSLLSRRLDLPRSPVVAVGAEMLIGGATMLVLGLARGEGTGLDPARISTSSLVAWGYLVVFGSVIAFSAYMYLLRRVSAAAVSTYAFVNPVVAVFLGWWFAGEAITTRILFAGGLIVVAVIGILIRPLPRGAPKVSADAETGPVGSSGSGAPSASDGGEGQAHAEA